MAEIEASITVNRPTREVFAFATDIRHATEWGSQVVKARHVRLAEPLWIQQRREQMKKLQKLKERLEA